LSALHLAEYAAQAMAAHGALQAGGEAQPGMLAALREVKLHVEHIHDIAGTLCVRAARRLARPEGSLYAFTVHADGRLLGEGRIAIALVAR
jgi:predicted hotdog family 3-hydroxylacyl-ACP dehydratase